MNKTTLFWLIAIALLLWIISGLFLCSSCLSSMSNDSGVLPITENSVKINKWKIQDGRAFKTTAPENFVFGKENFEYNKPISTGLTGSLEEVAKYLKDNPNRSLDIVGSFSEKEVYSGIHDNIGIARATDVKNVLVNLGVAASQISTGSNKILLTAFQNTLLRDGVSFSFSELVKNDTRLEDIKTRLWGKAITLRFPTGQSAVSLTSQQKKDFTDIIYYLDNVSTSKLEIGGHTDNVGELASNIALSTERSNFVKNYLVKNGIQTGRMNAVGFGPNNPLNSNSNASEKALNRRVEVVLKD